MEECAGKIGKRRKLQSRLFICLLFYKIFSYTLIKQYFHAVCRLRFLLTFVTFPTLLSPVLSLNLQSLPEMFLRIHRFPDNQKGFDGYACTIKYRRTT